MQMLIGKEWVDAAEGRTFERKSPATGQVVGTYPEAGPADVDRAVLEARRAFDDGKWSFGPARARAAVLRKAADLMRAQTDVFVKTLVDEVGKPVVLAKGEVAGAVEVLEYYAGIALDLHGEAYSQQSPDALGLALREPVGVVGVITPWNFPLVLVCWKLAPALAAGCTVVAKPSHHTPACVLELARLMLEAGLPPGVFNVVTGAAENGAVVGNALVTHPGVDKIAFTGSTATGKKVMAAAAGTLKRVSLELGGKSPNVVFADAPLDAAATGALWGIYMNAGQVCQAGSRLLVDEKIKDAFVDKLLGLVKEKLRVGDPSDPKTNVGPIISEAQLERVMGYVESGKKDAKLLLGGGRPSRPGLFVEPTVFDGVKNDMPIARDEIFGPVLSILSFKDEAEATRIANETMYGLAAAVWTRDLGVAMRTAKSLRAGTIWVNAYHAAGQGLGAIMPYGGYKASGLGRELGREGLREYLEVKSVHIKL